MTIHPELATALEAQLGPEYSVTSQDVPGTYLTFEVKRGEKARFVHQKLDDPQALAADPNNWAREAANAIRTVFK